MLVLLLILAQTDQPPDSLRSEAALIEDVYQDSLGGGVSRVTFGADTVIFYTDTKNVLLLSGGWVTYGDMTVYSDSIRFSTSDRVLSAYNGARLWESGKGGDSLSGESMHYAVETGKGVMYAGSTQIEEGYFHGEGVWLVEEDVLLINRGYYTTCERNPPHYDFYGSQMKVILNDMVIARPILLRVGKIPVLAAPFWYLPIGNERKSGLMPFNFGQSGPEGWFFKDIRYYWAINDYSQATFSLDVMTVKGFRPGFDLTWLYGPSRTEYADGKLAVNYIREADTRATRWNLKLNNTSFFPDGTRLTADVNLRSDATYIQEYINDPDSLTQVIARTTQSHLQLSRRVLGRNLSLSASRTDDLVTGKYDMTLPSFSFPWLRGPLTLWDFLSINFSSFSVNNRYDHDYQADTLSGDTTWTDTRTTSFSQPFSLSWSYSLLGAYTFTQSWGAPQSLTWTDDTLIRGGSYTLSNSFRTTFYRIFDIRALGMNGMLHSVSPSITYSVKPATEVIHPWIVYPRFDTSLASHSIGLNLNQNFQAKFRSKSDTARFNKQNLLRVNLGTSINLLTDSLNPVTASVELPTGLPVSARVSGGYDVYTTSFTSLQTSLDLRLHDVIFPLLGWEPSSPSSPVTHQSSQSPPSEPFSEEIQDSLSIDSLPPDSLPFDTLKSPGQHQEEETFVQRFSRSRLTVTDNWTLTPDSLSHLTTSAHMLTLRTDIYLPWELQLQLFTGLNLTEPQDTFLNYITSYHLTLVKGLHCWEAVFEVAPRNLLDWRLENLEWNFYLRIKDLPDIEISPNIFRSLGGP